MIQGKAQIKVKLKSVSFYKKKAWKLVSEYIRRRDSNFDGFAMCVTCGRVKHWKEGDAGHFIDGRRNAIVYDPRNIHFQCKPCNGSFINQQLDPKDIKQKYYDFMLIRYGAEVIRELRAENKKTKQFTREELMELIETYKEKLSKLPS